MDLPSAVLPDLQRLLAWGLRSGVTFGADPDGTLVPLPPAPLPPPAVVALARVGPVAAQALATLELPAPGLAHAVLWWEVAARQLHLDDRARLAVATVARRDRLQALRAVHLMALADVSLRRVENAPPTRRPPAESR